MRILIASTIESFKRLVSNKYNLIVGEDFNVNLLDLDDDNAIEFLNAVNLLALHPTITLLTRVTNTTKSLIDNFLCDFSFLPANTNVITTGIRDHYAIALHIPNINYRPISILTIFSKLLENIFYNRLIQLENSNSILNSNQFGFQTGKSTSSAVTHVTSVLINKINNNKHTAFVLLDLKDI